MDATVVIATFGAPTWQDLADRAASSVPPGIPVIRIHGSTLHGARNDGLAQVTTDWVVFLDADDELTPDYFAAMATGTADLRAPAVSYVRRHHAPRRPGLPKVAGHTHDCTAECLPAGNWLVVGSAVRTELVRRVGGWKDWALYEDWDLWLRCWRAGATIEAIPAAVYRAHVRFDSRNRSPTGQFKDRVHHAIHRANFPELYQDAA